MTTLTEHFTLEEFTVSNTGERMGIDNTPSAAIRANIQRTAEVLERIRTLLGHSVIITSGYRCPALNKAVNGAALSAHVNGLAADIIVPGYGTPYDVCLALKGSLEGFGIDQLIWEFNRWTHVGLRAVGARCEVLTIDAAGTRVGLA
tara:strand:- start:4308 stop:4748 length:441 start_codon:yes stop_codon:yes gene_type:complete